MKKLMVLLLISGLLVVGMAGCANTLNTSQSGSAKAISTQASIAVATTETASVEAEQTEENKEPLLSITGRADYYKLAGSLKDLYDSSDIVCEITDAKTEPYIEPQTTRIYTAVTPTVVKV